MSDYRIEVIDADVDEPTPGRHPAYVYVFTDDQLRAYAERLIRATVERTIDIGYPFLSVNGLDIQRQFDAIIAAVTDARNAP